MASPASTASASDPVRHIRDALETAARVASTAAAGETKTDLNQSTWRGRISLAHLDVEDLDCLITEGHLVDLRINAAPWSLHLRRGGTDGEVTEATGPLTAAVAQAQLDELADALSANDFAALINLLREHDADITLQVTNDPTKTGTHWAASSRVVTDAVGSDLWIPFARQVSKEPGVLLLDDLGDAVIGGDALTIVGPEAAERDPRPVITSRRDLLELDLTFRTARSPQGVLLPSPLPFAELSSTAEGTSSVVADVAGAMRKLTALIIWSLLANSSEPAAGAVAVHINGARQLDIKIEPTGDEGMAHLVEMYQWVATSPEIDRLYFAQQALTLAIVSPSDANSAPEPALRTARSLYDLSRRNSVSEVMAARRSARETALSASRSAASQAREAASKAVERAIVQVLAAAGVVVAQLQDALSLSQSAALLALLAVVCALSGVATDFVVLRSAREGLDHELRDLKRYRDTLSKEDVRSAKRTGAVRAARSDLRLARITAWIVYGVATVALAIAAAITFDHRDDAHPDPAPTSSSMSPAPMGIVGPIEVTTRRVAHPGAEAWPSKISRVKDPSPAIHVAASSRRG